MTRKLIRDFEEELAALKQKQALLETEIQTVERMIRKAKGEAEPTEQEVRPRRPNVKGIVLALIQERASLGITPSIAVEIAAQRGVALEKATVSSLLSRLKNDGIVKYDGTVYREVRSAKAPAPSESSADMLH